MPSALNMRHGLFDYARKIQTEAPPGALSSFSFPPPAFRECFDEPFGRVRKRNNMPGKWGITSFEHFETPNLIARCCS
jgi:hypothetical protein